MNAASRRKKWGWLETLLLLLVGLMPLVLGAFFTVVEANYIVEQRSRSMAKVLLHQAETISTQTWAILDSLKPLQDKPCKEVEPRLIRMGAMAPYSRSVGLMRGGQIYCSSEMGMFADSFIQRLGMEQSLSEGRHSISLPGIAALSVPPTVVFMEIGREVGAYVRVDAQSLIDYMDAMSALRPYGLSVQFGKGYEIALDAQDQSAQESVFFKKNIYELESTNLSDIKVRIESYPLESVETWRNVFLAFLPLFIALSLVLMGGLVYWWRRRSLYREDIKKGIANKEFSVFYQPIYNVRAQKFTGVEALMRWQRPDGRWTRPDVFIAVAESDGMIIPLTRHLFDLVQADVQHWKTPAGFHLGVNIAAEHLHHPSFLKDVRKFESRVALHSLHITLELTERSLIENDAEVIKVLQELRRGGLKIALDDFGTGQSSLAYLQNFPIDYLKIDHGFVETVVSASSEVPILDAIIALSQKLKLDVVAEGVETMEQLAHLQRCGVTYIQGYLFAKPMGNADFMQWMSRQEAGKNANVVDAMPWKTSDNAVLGVV